jgi:short-subunit dehydrogenase
LKPASQQAKGKELRMQPQGYALITGASSGIGEEFARQLAAQGWSLILVARSKDKLEKVRGELMSAHMGIDVVAIPLDLTTAGAPAELFQRTQAAHLDVDLLVNNAGFGAFAEFASLALGRVRQMLDLNIVALVELTHLYMQPMMQRRRGGIINVASVAAFAPLPYSTVYAATKAFVKSFSDALYEEAQRRGVHVMAVNPGSTETDFFRVAGESPFSHRARMQTSAEVVQESLRAFERKKSSVVTGASNRLLTVVLTLLPRRWITSTVGRVMRRADIGGAGKGQ